MFIGDLLVFIPQMRNIGGFKVWMANVLYPLFEINVLSLYKWAKFQKMHW